MDVWCSDYELETSKQCLSLYCNIYCACVIQCQLEKITIDDNE